jgi:hypothetical protein
LVVVWKWIRIRETNGAILDSLSNLWLIIYLGITTGTKSWKYKNYKECFTINTMERNTFNY